MALSTNGWTYKSGSSINLIGGSVTVASSADNVRPSNCAYVSQRWGDDTYGNGSRSLPYATISKGLSVITGNTSISSCHFIIVESGEYFEGNFGFSALGKHVIGDGNVIINGYGKNYFADSAYNAVFRNITFKNFNVKFINEGVPPQVHLVQCKMINNNVVNTVADLSTNPNSTQYIADTLFDNCTRVVITETANASSILRVTIRRCAYVYILTPTGVTSVIGCTSKFIIRESNVHFATAPQIDYSLFYQNNYKLGGSPAQPATGFYPTTPSGYTKYDTASALKTAVEGVWSTGSKLANCKVEDPLHNNYAAGDYTISFNSPARNLGFDGFYVGAFAPSLNFKISPTASVSSFDNSTASNFTIGEDSLTQTVLGTLSSIQTKPLANIKGFNWSTLNLFGSNAGRNGYYVDAFSDLSATVVNAGDTLENGEKYKVFGGTATYNGNNYVAGKTVYVDTALASVFSTSTGAWLQKIVETPSREVIGVRLGDGAAGYTASGSIEEGAWYYVENNTIDYDSVTIAVGSYFKGTATATYSGSDNPRKIFGGSDAFFYMEANQAITVNTTTNNQSGDITYGNGDVSFNRTNALKTNKKHVQLEVKIQPANIPAA